uniref:Uncharacterized protein LOC113790144 n=1 Tax=Dermatophagoides pteronyssinus TaxID=6956 RepID=A0A6P6XRT4_DERPT|nr:uncharacterized protein LOC113790144 [Dermatophagoides pteronyssinus]
MMDENSLYEHVRRRRLHVYENGPKFHGITPGLDASKPPEWYDPVAFKHAQKLFDKYQSILSLTSFMGLILGLMSDDEILRILLSTGNSETVDKLFTRYLSTIKHIEDWFRYDPFDTDSKSFKSLKMVRTMHCKVADKLNNNQTTNKQNAKQINQREMFLTQGAFFGLSALIPKQIGYHRFTQKDFHSIFHFWRVIGYCMGIEDEFNICNGSDEEVVEMCRQIYHENSLLKIRQCAERYPMSRAVHNAFYGYIMTFSYSSMMHYLAPILNLDIRLYPLTTFKEWFEYQLFTINNEKII